MGHPHSHKFKYEIGYRFGHYEIVDYATKIRQTGTKAGKPRYFYTLKCLQCGTKIDRESQCIGKDIRCQVCRKNMRYAKYKPGDIVNGLEILEHSPFLANNGTVTRAYLARCPIDGYQSVHTEHNLLQGKGCVVCANGKIMVGVNDISTVAPWMTNWFADKEQAKQYGVWSKTKAVFKCPCCGELTKPLSVCSVYRSGRIPCRRCGDGISTPEKIMYGILSELGIEFDYQVKFSWSQRKYYDFYIPSLSMIIETHGSQHYRDCATRKWDSLETNQANDRLKECLAKQHNIDIYISIDCSTLDPFELFERCTTAITLYFDVASLDREKIVRHSLRSFCVRTCEIWNSGQHDIDIIATTLKINPGTVRRYLRVLTGIGILNVPYPIINIA